MEVKFSGFQEAVLKVVEVEEHRVDVELRLWVAVREVEPAGTTQLDIRQLADGALQQFLLGQRITATGFATATDGIIQRHRTEVSLQVAQFVVGCGQHLRHRQLALREVARQIDKSMIFVAAGAYATDDAAAIIRYEAVILAVGTCSRQFFRAEWLCPTPLFV